VATESLSRHIRDIARRLLGEPNPRLSTRVQLRFGTNGSVAVEIAGAKAATWFDHESEIGGCVWDLLRIKGGMEKSAAARWLREKFGIEIEEKRGRSPRRRIAAAYDYSDERGALLFQVVRFQPKEFRQRRPGPNGEWIWNIKGIRPVLYRLPELIAAPAGSRVYIAEGEKDVDNLRHLGVIATTSPGGAAKPGSRSKWRVEYTRYLAGFHVIILPDNDDAGRAHAKTIAASLAGVAATVRILSLPDLPHKADVSDWIAAGGTREQLESLAASSEQRQIRTIWCSSRRVLARSAPSSHTIGRRAPSGCRGGSAPPRLRGGSPCPRPLSPRSRAALARYGRRPRAR
jgi:hypothetical protein